MFHNAGYSGVRESASDRKYVKEESKEEKEHRYSFDGEAVDNYRIIPKKSET